jgi:hypothetical protein
MMKGKGQLSKKREDLCVCKVYKYYNNCSRILTCNIMTQFTQLSLSSFVQLRTELSSARWRCMNVGFANNGGVERVSVQCYWEIQPCEF